MQVRAGRKVIQPKMHFATLGVGGPRVSAIGLGCMGMSPGIYGAADDREGLATIRSALEAGVTLIDTGDFYGMGHNEMLIREALTGMRECAFISVKFGALRDPSGGWGGNDGRPQAGEEFSCVQFAPARHRLRRS